MLGIGGDGGIVVEVMMVSTVLRVVIVNRKPLSAFANHETVMIQT